MRFLGLIVVGLVVAGSPALAQYRLNNGIAAIANDAVITHQDVLRQSEEIINIYRRTYFNNPEVFKQKSDLAMSDALEQLIDRQLVLHDFKTVGFQIQESWIDDNIKERIRDQFGDRITLTKTLQAQGITYETFRQRERDRFIQMLMERKNVREALLISPTKIERYYQTNLALFKVGDRVKLRMIRLSRAGGSSVDDVRELAMDIRSKIEGGASFAQMASTYSESWAKEGGLWGWKEQSQVKLGLSEVAFGLSTGQCSKVVSLTSVQDDEYWVYHYDAAGKITVARKFTEKGPEQREAFVEEKKYSTPPDQGELPVPPQEFYLMYVEEKETARTRPLAEVRDEIEKDLLLQERARLQKAWIKRLREKSFVRYFY